MKKIKLLIMSFWAFIILAFVSCSRNEGPVIINDLPDDIRIGDDFVYDVTTTFYLWEEYIPEGINKYGYDGPAELFDAMYYPTLDFWSFVTDDYEGLLNDLNGVKKAAGFKFQLFRYSTTSSEIFALVEYVNPDGQAYKAGLKRGDAILSVNDQTLTENNYSLLYEDNMELGIGELVGNDVVNLNITINVTSIEQAFNPILHQQIIETGGKKIGYLVYEQFIEEYKDTLVKVMQYFDSQDIDELVLDLRYNPGGYVITCDLLAGMLVPAANINDVFLIQQYNTLLTSYYQLQADPDLYFVENFRDTTVNLGLSRLFVLTSERTASASEAIINGLKPYMPVVLIGATTHGKYTGANLFHDPEEQHNWGVYLIISKIANADYETDYYNGFTPDYVVKDDYITPIGDLDEPLLAQAISLITGVTKKSTSRLSDSFIYLGAGYQNQFEKEGMLLTFDLQDWWKN